MRDAPNLLRLSAWMKSFLGRESEASLKPPSAATPLTTYSAATQPVVEAPVMYSLDCGTPRRILMLGTANGALSKPGHWLEGQSVKLFWQTSFARARALLCQRGQFSHLLIDLDGLGGIAKRFDMLRRLRDEMPQIPVILFSREFLVDDLSAERMWICDASLRPTATFSTLELALLISEVNNQHWQTQVTRIIDENARKIG